MDQAISLQVSLFTKIANLLSRTPSFSFGYKSINFFYKIRPITLSPKNSSFSLLKSLFELLCVKASINKDSFLNLILEQF